MKTFVQLALLAILFLIINPAKTTATTVSPSPQLSHWKPATVTKSVLAHVIPRAQKTAFKNSNLLIVEDDDDDEGWDELVLQVALPRPRLLKPQAFDWNSELSDYARFRLSLARPLALEKYNTLVQT